jgi:cell shape-determining protein MreC
MRESARISGRIGDVEGSRFSPIFAALMVMAFLVAFILPARFSALKADDLQGIFKPVSSPVRGMAGFVYRRFHHNAVVDDRSPEAPRPQATVYDENHQLLSAYASLKVKFDQLSQLNADRQAVGDIRSLCKPATVTGTDAAGFRESLNLSVAASAAAIKDRPVIRGNPSQSPLPCDLIGKIVRSGPAGAQARLVTDPGFRLTAKIARYEPQPDGSLKLTYIGDLHPLVQGMGHNEMAIQSNLSMQQVSDAGIKINDLVLLDDRDWPANIQGFEVGRITSINRQINSPLLADIRIEPQTNLMRLTEVMVMVKD